MRNIAGKDSSWHTRQLKVKNKSLKIMKKDATKENSRKTAIKKRTHANKTEHLCNLNIKLRSSTRLLQQPSLASMIYCAICSKRSSQLVPRLVEISKYVPSKVLARLNPSSKEMALSTFQSSMLATTKTDQYSDFFKFRIFDIIFGRLSNIVRSVTSQRTRRDEYLYCSLLRENIYRSSLSLSNLILQYPSPFLLGYCLSLF